jgi:hypothetical protein
MPSFRTIRVRTPLAYDIRRQRIAALGSPSDLVTVCAINRRCPCRCGRSERVGRTSRKKGGRQLAARRGGLAPAHRRPLGKPSHHLEHALGHSARSPRASGSAKKLFTVHELGGGLAACFARSRARGLRVSASFARLPRIGTSPRTRPRCSSAAKRSSSSSRTEPEVCEVGPWRVAPWSPQSERRSPIRCSPSRTFNIGWICFGSSTQPSPKNMVGETTGVVVVLGARGRRRGTLRIFNRQPVDGRQRRPNGRHGRA